MYYIQNNSFESFIFQTTFPTLIIGLGIINTAWSVGLNTIIQIGGSSTFLRETSLTPKTDRNALNPSEQLSNADRKTLNLIYLENSQILPPYSSKETTKELLSVARIRVSTPCSPVKWVIFNFFDFFSFCREIQQLILWSYYVGSSGCRL